MPLFSIRTTYMTQMTDDERNLLAAFLEIDKICGNMPQISKSDQDFYGDIRSEYTALISYLRGKSGLEFNRKQIRLIAHTVQSHQELVDFGQPSLAELL